MTVEEIRAEYRADQDKATSDFASGVIPDIESLDMLRAARWSRFKLDVAAVEHVSGGSEHCAIASSEILELEDRYSEKRDLLLIGEVTGAELTSFTMDLFAELFSFWFERGCFVSLPPPSSYLPYVEEASSLAVDGAALGPFDPDGVVLLCRVQRLVNRDLVSSVMAAYGRIGCGVGQ